MAIAILVESESADGTDSKGWLATCHTATECVRCPLMKVRPLLEDWMRIIAEARSMREKLPAWPMH